ncbi:MAG TPA: pentapeptide repeat-containing protein [Roseiarcus sp.]|nr:pentapeptide repeat-containing protein [Roseiarcus sp.]
MPETLLTPSSIKMYGRVMTSLTFVNDTHPGPGYNNFLQHQLAGKEAKFARIYGFTFEGTYYPLPRPSLFLVHGNGNPVGNWTDPSTLDQSGVMAREWDFSNPNNPPPPPELSYWEYEKGDFSLRLDLEAGPLEQILLAAALRAGADMADRSRSGANLSGANLAGANLSGANLRNR